MGIIVLLPGGFKPPHAGHLALANKYAEHPEVDEVKVLIGPAERDGVTRDQALKIWKLLPKNSKVKVIPVKSDNPFASAFDMILDLPKNADGVYAFAASSKGEDAARSKMFVKAIEDYKTKPAKDKRYAPKEVKAVELPVDTKPLLYKGRKDKLNGSGISASVLRQDLQSRNKEDFYSNYPGVEKSTVDQIYTILKKNKGSKKESTHISDLLEERAFSRLMLINMLMEGGAAGHMAHPFDIPSVKTGKDLISIFEETAKFLQKNEVPVKIDGINSSIRLVNLDKKQQFVLDRGSNKPLDVKGITTKDLLARFGEGHGMINIGGKVLKIFNEALPKIKSDLDKLGLTKNPNIMLNIEYVEGQSNVQKYASNFLVIHNLLEIEQVSPTKRQTKEVAYSKDTLQSLVNNLNATAKKYGFQVYNIIPAKAKSSFNFGGELSKSYTVFLNKKDKQTKSLEKWLDEAQNTKGQKLKLKDGKTVDALSKQVYVWIESGKPVEDLVADPKDSKLATDSFAIYLATIKLGDVILRSLTSPLGDVNEQEGIVVRDKKVYDKPYKITGSFIIRGMASSFQK